MEQSDFMDDIKDMLLFYSDIITDMNYITLTDIFRNIIPDKLIKMVFSINFHYTPEGLYIKFFISGGNHHNARVLRSYFESCFELKPDKNKYIYQIADPLSISVIIDAKYLANNLDVLDKEYKPQKHWMKYYILLEEQIKKGKVRGFAYEIG